MAVKSFDIDYAEIRRVQIAYSDYYSSLSEGGALCSIDSACVNLSTLDSFSGESAAAIKNYFLDVHCSLVEAIHVLASQLLTDYSGKFWPQFDSGEISETQHDARWPENEMTIAASKMEKFSFDDLQEVKQRVRRALRALPEGIVLFEPNANQVEADFAYEKRKTEEVRDAVEEADVFGANLFNSDEGEFSSLARALSSAIAGSRGLGGANISSYAAGGFSQVAGTAGLSTAFFSCKKDQARLESSVSAARRECIKLEKSAIREKMKEVNKGMAWDAVKATGFSIVAALVSTPGNAVDAITALIMGGPKAIPSALLGIIAPYVDVYIYSERYIDGTAEGEGLKYEVANGVKKAGELNDALSDPLETLIEKGTDKLFDEAGIEDLKWAKNQLIGIDPLGLVSDTYSAWAAEAEALRVEALEELETLESREAALSEAEEKIGQDHTWSSERS